MYLPEFSFHQPLSVQDAIGLLGQKPNAVAMAGGTDLLVEMKKSLRRHEDIVSLAKIDELKLITEASVEIISTAGIRTFPLSEFFTFN